MKAERKKPRYQSLPNFLQSKSERKRKYKAIRSVTGVSVPFARRARDWTVGHVNIFRLARKMRPIKVGR